MVFFSGSVRDAQNHVLAGRDSGSRFTTPTASRTNARPLPRAAHTSPAAQQRQPHLLHKMPALRVVACVGRKPRASHQLDSDPAAASAGPNAPKGHESSTWRMSASRSAETRLSRPPLPPPRLAGARLGVTDTRREQVRDGANDTMMASNYRVRRGEPRIWLRKRCELFPLNKERVRTKALVCWLAREAAGRASGPHR